MEAMQALIKKEVQGLDEEFTAEICGSFRRGRKQIPFSWHWPVLVWLL